MVPGYAELHCVSNYSFLRGASDPEELVHRAAQLGYAALAVTDECSVSGIVRAHLAAKKAGIRLLVGTELSLACGLRLVLLAQTLAGYERLCELVTRARRAAPKGEYRLARDGFPASTEGLLALWLPAVQAGEEEGAWVRDRFPGRAWIAVELHKGPDDATRLAALQGLGEALGLPLAAAGDVHMHRRNRKRLQDVLTAIRLRVPVAQAGRRLQPNGERYLRPIGRIAAIYPPALLAATLDVAARCAFSLDEIRYEYPQELVPAGETPATHLRKLALEGLARRYPAGPPPSVATTVEHELRLIAEMGYEPFFLTVHDIVVFARSRRILCQGRGSAANSAVCYCLGITEVDPGRMSVLFERFISKERNEPPDIDVDFEHQRREEVIQYLYAKYGRERAALTAVVITYQPRSALRDVGKALGLSLDQVDLLAKSLSWWDDREALKTRLVEAGFDPENRVVKQVVELTGELVGFPRHLSQHPGGFVIDNRRLSRLVPVENASMPERTVIQWDKDDLDALGLLKVDVLGLGMLSCIRRALDLVNGYRGAGLTMAGIPAEDPAVYEMVQRADTIGVFQIESRAQMSMLPRLKPACFYDLVIEVAIVRPGPIMGGMVHPYLRRREGKEPVTYPSEAVRGVLERTLGRVDLPGAGDAARGRGRRIQPRRGRPAAPGHGRLAPPRRHRALPGEAREGDARAGLHPGLRGADLPADPGVRRIRLPGIPRRELRPPGLRLLLAQAPRAGGLRLRAPEQPAARVLQPVPDRAGRPPARGRGAAGRCPGERGGLHPGARPGGRTGHPAGPGDGQRT